MENKYYTPQLEELIFGMEIEVKNTFDKFFLESAPIDTWFKAVVHFGVLGNVENLQKLILDKQLRIKILDKDDIESLGWEGSKANSVYFTKEDYRLVHWITNGGRDISIFEKYDGGTEEECLIRKAKIENKTELKKLMKQLGI